MQQGREEELEEENEDEGDGGPERVLEKSPFQLTAGDVYDISSVVGRDLLQLGAGPRVPAALARLQFRIVRVLEMLEALVSESSLAEEQLRLERDSLRREVEALRAAGGPGGAQQVGGGGGAAAGEPGGDVRRRPLPRRAGSSQQRPRTENSPSVQTGKASLLCAWETGVWDRKKPLPQRS